MGDRRLSATGPGESGSRRRAGHHRTGSGRHTATGAATTQSPGRRRAPRRAVGPGTLLWLASGAAALLMTLGVSGTLSDWTSAVLGNSTNSAATATAVVLQETGPASQGTPVCRSSDGAQATVNSYTCTTVNKYGGTASPLSPGSSRTVDVTFKNIGGANATSFQLAPGSCTQSPTAGSGTPAAANVCTNGDLTIAVSCSPGATYAGGSAWADLVYAAAAPPGATKTHTASAGDLDVGAFWTCRFTVALGAGAGIADQGVTVTQPLTWTLSQ